MEIDQFVLVWVFTLVIGFAHKFIVQFVQSAHLMLLLLVDVVALLDLHLISNHKVFLIVLLGQSFLPLFLEEVYLGFCVQLIDTNTCDLVEDVFEFDFLFGDVFTQLLGLFE